MPNREPQFRRAFGRALKAARQSAGLTQRELAERGEIAEKYLSRIELGIATPSLFVAVRLAHAANVGLDVLTDTSSPPVPSALAAIVALLRGQSSDEIERARRILLLVLRASTDSTAIRRRSGAARSTGSAGRRSRTHRSQR